MTFEKALRLDDVPVRGVARANVNGKHVAIVRSEDRVFALHGVCPHEAAPLGDGSRDGGELVCPLHEGRFDPETGKANPETDWVSDIRTYPVQVKDGEIWIDL